jgi:hypothetical protein
MKHTPEPWSKEDFQRFAFTDITQRGLQIEDFARSVACVNACAGMDDPAAEIERLKAIESVLPEVLRRVQVSLLEDVYYGMLDKDSKYHIEVIHERIKHLEETNL